MRCLIQRNFFSGPAQIALVVDPLAGTEGVFCWHAGDIARLYERPTRGKWIALGEAPRRAAAVPQRRRIELDMAPDARPYPIVFVVLAIALGLGLGLLGARVAFPSDGQIAAPPSATPNQSQIVPEAGGG